MMSKLISLPFVALVALAVTASAQKVQLGDLTIEGVTVEDTLGRQAHAYFSIPFAEPPVGPLRFRDPVPKEYAAGTMDATQRGPLCMQDLSSFTVEKGGGAFW